MCNACNAEVWFEKRIVIKVFKNLERGLIMSVEFHIPPIKANDLMVVNNKKASFVMSPKVTKNKKWDEQNICKDVWYTQKTLRLLTRNII